ncbi:ovarian-specific serine/threonine-protein kinase Lok-like [Contarinia nasturtii]|uniref:ovarian-specific serine/threonine-protein kinase Lok-like n=1 Tax=Contarinia nasturtii TaxID=265458 RepID=UPI0012D46D3C|nr:ovarian-specific serine/threonine-protein kinase Lok-like [Contarinia nasturtii]
MSDDEEMIDLSQMTTQSGTYKNSYESQDTAEHQPEPEPWGKLKVYKVERKRLGMAVWVPKELKLVGTCDLVKERTTIGRKGDLNVCGLINDTRDNIPNDRLKEISSIHFSITKEDVNDQYCPVIIEDLSTNGTFVNQEKNNIELQKCENFQRIDEKIKRRILGHKDSIFIQKHPTICFEFLLLQSIAQVFPETIQNDIFKDYHIGRELGSGAYGKVYFVQNRITCQPFALKYTTNNGNENKITDLLKEVYILGQLKHPCILPLHTVKTYVESVVIFIEYMEGGDLYNRIKSKTYLSEPLTKFILYQILCGVEYMHEQHVTHRDIKPENILLATIDDYTSVKVSDFGLSKRVTSSNGILSTQCGTLRYQAPEVRRANYTNKVDIWSLGVILYLCLSGQFPPHLKDELNFNEKWDDISYEAKNIVRETLKCDPKERPSAKELLTSRSWFSKEDEMVIKAHKTMNEKN